MEKRVCGSNLITNYSKSQQLCVLLHILFKRGHFEKLNCVIKFMGLFNTAKKSEFYFCPKLLLSEVCT